MEKQKMMNRIAITLAATAVAVAGCAPVGMVGSTARSTGGATARSAPGTPLESDPVDPYSTTGTWLVPDEIAPGTYRVSVHGDGKWGYGAVCGDYECDPFGEPGMISNDNYNGPGIMVVPQSAVSVETRNITLTPMKGQR